MIFGCFFRIHAEYDADGAVHAKKMSLPANNL